jgi:hypothetical protein
MTCPGSLGEHLNYEIAGCLLHAAERCTGTTDGGAWMLFVGDDWAEDHHDIEIVDEKGRRVA